MALLPTHIPVYVRAIIFLLLFAGIVTLFWIKTGFMGVVIAGALGLLTARFRRAAAIGLAAYAVLVFPANINHAVNAIAAGGLPTSWWYHAPRLALQPLLVWWPLFASGVVGWPFFRNSRNA